MPNQELTLKTIGVIHSPYRDVQGAPIQPSGARGSKGEIVVDKAYEPGLKDLEGFSHLILLYHFHLCNKEQLTVTPFLDKTEHGVFATRAPTRPNHIGVSIVRLNSREKNTLNILDVDVLDGTPLLDIKPLVPGFDLPEQEIKVGWLEQKAQKASELRADERFK
jgi:tRNA-Thr(GGU) m(6)t(6)A37 methyltransferase TsaA